MTNLLDLAVFGFEQNIDYIKVVDRFDNTIKKLWNCNRQHMQQEYEPELLEAEVLKVFMMDRHWVVNINVDLEYNDEFRKLVEVE